MVENLNISVHQIRTVTGDIEGNTNRIIECLENDATKDVDVSIFPETAISGYMCGALWDDPNFVRSQIEKLKEIKQAYIRLGLRGIIIVGFVSMHGIKRNGFPRLKNSVAIIGQKGIRTYDKQMLADSDHHEDKKYFVAGNQTKVFSVELPSAGRMVKIGVLICEDAWSSQHSRDIPQEMKELGAEILFVINQSYFHYGKQDMRIKQFGAIARSTMLPVITVNSVGVGDILKNIVIFDGGSLIFNDRGRLVNAFPKFKPWSGTFRIKDLHSIQYEKQDKYYEILSALVFEQRELFAVLGMKNAQVHVSGGLDSSVVAAIMLLAMGAEHTVLITNPSKLNEKSLKYVNRLEEKLGVKVWSHPITEILEAVQSVDDRYMRDAPKLSDTAQASIHAVLRTVLGLSDSHRFGSGIVATGNHTEIVLGWASFHDIGSIGVHAIVGDLTKVELYELAEYINKEAFHDTVIPADLYDGVTPPAAELPDAMEDPIDYWVQSGICASLIRDRKSRDDLVFDYRNHSLSSDYFPRTKEVYKYSRTEWENQIDFAIGSMKRSVFKAAQGAPIVIISPRSRGFSNRETIINRYEG